MPEFLPFVGTRYDPQMVRVENVVSPPYDVISNEYRDRLYARDPYNVIRLELNRDEDPYKGAGEAMSEWKNMGILKPEQMASYYVYYQTFNTPAGVRVTRQGVIGRLLLAEYAAKSVLPHERTLAAPKRDRLQLMERTSANLSPIFGLISDESFLFDQTLELATVHKALIDVDEVLPNGDTVRHTMWRLDDEMAQDRIKKLVSKGTVIIADGHHRYETALKYHELHPEVNGADHIMIFLTNLRSEGAVVLPTHRLLHSMSDFDQYQFLTDLGKKFKLLYFTTREEGLAALDREIDSITLIEFEEDPKWVLVLAESVEKLSLATLPAMRLQEDILKAVAGLTQDAIDNKTNLLYPHTPHEADEMKESQKTNALFFLRPVTTEELAAVVESGEFMPQKSTYFYPKLLTGLVFHEFGLQPKV